jgi:hypothetical protein
MVSLFANANYTFRDKYILSATVRRDGSSKFINNKYGVFPGVSAAWRVSQEPFLEGSKFLSSLKLRASYGLTGNNENFPELATPGELLEIQRGLYQGAGREFNSAFYLQDLAGNWRLPAIFPCNRI